MSDAKLTKELGLALLSRLAEDDAFRARFEATPARALVEIGVPAEVVVNLRAGCIERRSLASKEAFRTLLWESSEETIASAMQMLVPSVSFREHFSATEGRVVEPMLAQNMAPSERIAVH